MKTDYGPETDGITHINIYSRGHTRLGVMLSNFYSLEFFHPEDGWFDSVEGYWYWLSCRDDRLRRVSGYRAKQLGRELGGKDWLHDAEFKRKIKLAIKTKIESNRELQELMSKNRLPYTHYYEYGGKVVFPEDGQWIVDFIQRFRIKSKGS